MNRKRWTLVAATWAMLAMTMGSLAIAQTGGGANGTTHVVLAPT